MPLQVFSLTILGAMAELIYIEVMVYSMCRLMIEACEAGNQTVIAHVKRIAKYSKDLPATPRDLCNQIFHTGKVYTLFTVPMWC